MDYDVEQSLRCIVEGRGQRREIDRHGLAPGVGGEPRSQEIERVGEGGGVPPVEGAYPAVSPGQAGGAQQLGALLREHQDNG